MMSIARALIALVALEHLYILTLEMFLWRTRGLKVFGMTPEFAETTAVLAKNQGLYNGFLAAGLFWSLPSADFPARATFFLACVIVAGLYGGATANKRIALVQAMPAAIALAALWLSLR